MRGTVKSFNPTNRYGFIEAETGEIHFFHATEWHLPIKPQKNLIVEFTPIEVEKGMRATNIQRARRTQDGK